MKTLLVFLLFSYISVVNANNTLGLPPVSFPKNNPQTPGKIALGKKLFNDVRFSTTQNISCASCHVSNLAFTDGKPLATGINGLTGLRNSPTLINSAFLTSYFHDGRRPSLESQSKDPLTNPVEHGLGNHSEVLKVILADHSYIESFLSVFGINAENINLDHVAKAIASYERTLISGNSRFDQYHFDRKKKVLSSSEARGLRIFRRKANCANCHEVSWDNALFTDNRFYNIGIGFDELRITLPSFLIQAKANVSEAIHNLNDVQKEQLGRFIVTRNTKDIGAYKTPTLRNISLTAPYMHDGSLKTLRDVVDYYDKGGKPNAYLNPAIFPLHLTTQEKEDLVAFLGTLTGYLPESQ